MEIFNQIVNVALPIIVTGVAGLLVKIIYPVGDVAIEYIKTKIEESGITKKLAQHQDEITTAKEIWNVVEEKYRISEKVEDLLVSKADMFDKLLLAKIPYLTQENLNDLRQAIAGEVNKGKQVIITDDTLKQSNVELQNINTQLTDTNTTLTKTVAQLQSDKDSLQNKLDTITNALNPVVTNTNASMDINANVTLDASGNLVQ